ncbi:glycosyltransferase family 4 protein [Gillisia sp. M10.2A]|uniref:Glycosyltransferase family 4 protein n=1 Tax=Gillisia lutea TaxID=2909668 RepID=A0ABS9ELA9_9FLAO|nr:glycosyltransferase family 4 protein [Gillisia lutea]MCF4102659.1 glycosyltransferase family 4 protein [Gillisia lutea]
MKIIILINSLGAGGAERSMVEFAKFLYLRNDVKLNIVCLKHKKIGLEEEVENFGINTIYYEGSSNLKSKINFVVDIIKKEKPDIIHSVLAESNLVLRLSRLLTHHGKVIQSLVNTPYSLERKKDSQLSWQKFQLAKKIDQWSARLTSNIFYHAITQEVYQHYLPLFKIRDNYRIIYRGRKENLNKKSSSISKDFLLINTGRQEFAKGQIDILFALNFIKQEYNITDINLQILGREGQYTKKIVDYIAANNLQDQVKIHGFVSDVEKRLANADAFIFPSYYEGLGGALLEAFSAKLPCICSNIPVLKEVVGSEKGALFSHPGDYKSLAMNILTLYNDKMLRKKLGDYSYKRFRDTFNLDTINLEMLQMYRDVYQSKV